MTKDYNSVYGAHIQQFIAMKRKLGFKFVKDAKLLVSIDVLAIETDQIAEGITKEFADLWIKKTLNESSRNHYQRAICLNHFSAFLCGLGIQSYLPKLPPPPKTTFIPHIYSPTEVNALFDASDKLRMPHACMSCSLICLPLLIRALYSTGIRIGEALALKDEDVNLVENYLRVRDSKNGKERIVPISQTLAEACRHYINYRNKIPSKRSFDYFFVKLDGSQPSPATVGVWFRRCLGLAGIPYIGMYQGPRVHDLRHTFAVTSLANMAESGIDLYVSLPILSTYLGHQSLESTNQYVRLTKHIYPDLIKDVNLICQDVFPKYRTMKPTDFSKYISDFISRYLPCEKGASGNTIAAYRDTFVLLLKFTQETLHIKIEKLTLDKITKETILQFLDWIQKERKCSGATRNSRLAAIHSFYKYLQLESLEHMHESQKILSIKFKNAPKETMNYLTIEGIKLLLQQPDTTTIRGRRDLTLLSLMYDTGSRVQEIIDLTPSMIRFNKPPTIKVIGKGNKARIIPMLDAQTEHLVHYLKEHRLNDYSANMYPLFFNSRKDKLTRAGINHILNKYAAMAREQNQSLIPEKISCHSLRHSKAMHLLQAGVNLVYIRDILGHVSIQTTEIYARVDSKQKREAIEKVYVNVSPNEEPRWTQDDNLLIWLKKF